MKIVESVLDIEVQDPEADDFSSSDLKWTKMGTEEHFDEVALIPYKRIDTFIIGECCNAECPTRFHIERGRKRAKGSLKTYKSDDFLEYKLYWCSFGPENYGEGGGELPSRKYRLNTRNRAPIPQSMRGCTCHFVIKRLYARPSLALIVYNDRRHVNKAGFVCHGPLDKDAIGPGAKKIPYICNEIQQQTMSMIYVGIPEESVLEKHIEGVQRYCGADAQLSSLASQYVQKLGMIIKRSTHELDLDDQESVRIWVDRHKKSVFFHQNSSETDSFILGIQTEWQLQQMIRFGHCSLLAADSFFGLKKLKYPLCTLLVFDSRNNALPVAWIISRSSSKADVTRWMKALMDRACRTELGFRICGFLIDDAAAEIDPIREIFKCPVLFSLWRIRRSWLRNIVRRCDKIEVQQSLFKRLGEVIYSIWKEDDASPMLEKLIDDFNDQTSFITYFKASWLPKIEMWLSTMKKLPLASLEASGAIEAYHIKLKSKLFDDTQLGAVERVDWLVHKLTTDMHSSYWLDRYADESDSFQSVKENYINTTSWNRALGIPDACVVFGDNDEFAEVSSSKDENSTRVVWNPGSEFAFCRCDWALKGNLCKHVIKVNMMSKRRHSMSYRSMREILTSVLSVGEDGSMGVDVTMGWMHQIIDQMKLLVDLCSYHDIGSVVNNMPLKWTAKGIRTTQFRNKLIPYAPSTPKKNKKRKRLLTLM